MTPEQGHQYLSDTVNLLAQDLRTGTRKDRQHLSRLRASLDALKPKKQ